MSLLTTVIEKDKKAIVKAAAVIALGQIGSSAGLRPLLRVLRQKRKNSRAFLRRAAAKSIGQIIETNESGRSTPRDFLPEEYKTSQAPKSIDVALKESVYETLNGVFRDIKENNDTRREAAFALGTLRLEKVRFALRGCTSDEDPFLAEICKEALLRVSTPAK